MALSATGPNGSIRTYALLDGGATITLVDKKIAQTLGLRGSRTNIANTGPGQ